VIHPWTVSPASDGLENTQIRTPITTAAVRTFFNKALAFPARLAATSGASVALRD